MSSTVPDTLMGSLSMEAEAIAAMATIDMCERYEHEIDYRLWDIG